LTIVNPFQIIGGQMVALLDIHKLSPTHSACSKGAKRNHLRLVQGGQTGSESTFGHKVVESETSLALPITTVLKAGILVAVVIIGISLIQGSPSAVAESQPAPLSPQPALSEGRFYTVRSGETLWDIAKSLTDGDPRDVVENLAQINGSDNVWVGQKLFIPSDLG
jgi:nucleoid-associated protein YgaU